MRILRPFLSYSSVDRDFVELVAARLVTYGVVPIYDHWWLRSAAANDVEGSKAELKMGVSHADAFVHFSSAAARQSMYADYECEWAHWRTCSDAPKLPMVFVILDGTDVHVPHWFHTILDATAAAKNADSVIAGLIDALGLNAGAEVPTTVSACRQLAQVLDLPRLRSEIYNLREEGRCEAAILLAYLDNDMDAESLVGVVRELERGLGTAEAERVILALGKLREKAAPAIDGIAQYIESGADAYNRARAVRLLGRIGPSSETISALIRIATHATKVRAAAVTELGHMGSSAAAAVPALVELSKTPDRHLRLVALTALGSIGNCSREVLVAVLEALSETERQGISPSQLHYNAMSLLNQLAPRDYELGPALVLAWQESRRFAEWMQATFPETDGLIRSGESGAKLERELLATASRILSTCQLAGADRPF